jgi:hypothetical protein
MDVNPFGINDLKAHSSYIRVNKGVTGKKTGLAQNARI